MGAPVQPGSIVILDFGGQYAHLIANRVRRLGAFSEIREPNVAVEQLRGAAGIILSGGPQSVYDTGSPTADKKIFDLGIPVLGLCYGHQWLAHTLGGTVEAAKVKEYGKTTIALVHDGGQFLRGLPDSSVAWMSHGDEVTLLPPGFSTIIKTKDCAIAGMEDPTRKIFGIQCHIEVTHTEQGMEILKRFVEQCEHAPWSIRSFTSHVSEQMLKEVGQKKVFMLVSGGVDSTVAFTLLNEVLGKDRVVGLLVDTGLMRKNEVKDIQAAFAALGITNLHVEDASAKFFTALKGVFDPEEKRKIIGRTFVAVQQEVSERMGLKVEEGWLLGQGTIYPDTIETGGTKHADHIKTHHNRVDAIQEMMEKGLVLEPLKELYKDEVRQLGEELGLPHDLVWRHPFPGPGLGVRILCESANDPWSKKSVDGLDAGSHLPHAILPVRSVGVQGDGRTYRHAVAFFQLDPFAPSDELLSLATTIPNSHSGINRVLLCTSHPDKQTPTISEGFVTLQRADLLRDADAIVNEEIRSAKLYEAIWQFPVVLLPCGLTKGGNSIVLRPIASTDAMTASAFILPPAVVEKMTKKLTALPGIDLVFLDLTSKPPGTIEWE